MKNAKVVESGGLRFEATPVAEKYVNVEAEVKEAEGAEAEEVRLSAV